MKGLGIWKSKKCGERGHIRTGSRRIKENHSGSSDQKVPDRRYLNPSCAVLIRMKSHHYYQLTIFFSNGSRTCSRAWRFKGLLMYPNMDRYNKIFPEIMSLDSHKTTQKKKGGNDEVVHILYCFLETSACVQKNIFSSYLTTVFIVRVKYVRIIHWLLSLMAWVLIFRSDLCFTQRQYELCFQHQILYFRLLWKIKMACFKLITLIKWENI